MSVESAKEFMDRVWQDDGLQEKIKGSDSEETFFSTIKGEGFDFSKADWEQAIRSSQDVELSEEDLRDASGGTGDGCFIKISNAPGEGASCMDAFMNLCAANQSFGSRVTDRINGCPSQYTQHGTCKASEGTMCAIAHPDGG